MQQEIPDGPPNIFPALLYRDAHAALDWLERAFGFERLMVVPGPQGTVLHAEMGLGPGILMLATSKPDRGWVSPRDLPGLHQTVCVRIDDVDGHYARAKAAGAEIFYDIKDTDYSREYSARDLEGHLWTFGNYQPSRRPQTA